MWVWVASRRRGEWTLLGAIASCMISNTNRNNIGFKARAARRQPYATETSGLLWDASRYSTEERVLHNNQLYYSFEGRSEVIKRGLYTWEARILTLSIYIYRIVPWIYSAVEWVRPVVSPLFGFANTQIDRLCGLVVRVLDFRCRGPGFDSQALQKKSSGSGTGSTQPREYNWRATS
jgi:hypothetical protein